MADNINTSKLNIVSYNCRGYNIRKKHYISQLLSECNILFLQEHWLSTNQLDCLATIHTKFLVHGVSGFADIGTVLSGRPFGGCAILYNKEINGQVIPICIQSTRIVAVKIIFSTYSLLLINVYMPYEDGSSDNSDEFANQLAIIESLLSIHCDCCPIIGGDFNVDLARKSRHSVLFNNFLINNDFLSSNKLTNFNLDYTYHLNMRNFSLIDHFVIPTSFGNMVMNLRIKHDIDNLSDHDAVFIELVLELALLATVDRQHCNRPAWSRATNEEKVEYANCLSDLLKSINIPSEAVVCRDACCTLQSHRDILNQYCHDIGQCCLNAGVQTIPVSKANGIHGNHCDSVPGWSEYVEPLREKSLFWHHIWSDAGKPHTGVLADIMRQTRLKYHHAIRDIYRQSDLVRQERFAETMLNNNNRDFWKEVKKIRNRHIKLPNVVDNHSGDADIANCFGEKYKDLYNSVPYNESELEITKNELKSDISLYCDVDELLVSPSEIKCAINKLNAGKSDGTVGLMSDHFLNAGSGLYIHLSNLLTGLLTHGFIPDDLSISSVIPISKGKNCCLNDSNNYRGICLSSIICKIIDLIILGRYLDKLSSSQLQFGFKSGCSTNMCTLLVKETVNYYTHNSSSVYCCLLDATKAFDRINYNKLFNLLIHRNIPSVVIRLLINLYTTHKLRIMWNGSFSEIISVKNGVKQGGILSPILFCVYLDNLILSLVNSGVGCYMGHICLSVLAYADDVVILAPTASAMRKLLAICDGFANEYDVKFNASKSKCILFQSACCSKMSCRGQFSVFKTII